MSPAGNRPRPASRRTAHGTFPRAFLARLLRSASPTPPGDRVLRADDCLRDSPYDRLVGRTTPRILSARRGISFFDRLACAKCHGGFTAGAEVWRAVPLLPAWSSPDPGRGTADAAKRLGDRSLHARRPLRTEQVA